jgi:hypothetical protein
MYATPVSLLRLPPPRRRVNQGKFAPAVPAVRAAPAERGRPLERSCGAWTPAKEEEDVKAMPGKHTYSMLNFTYEDNIKIKSKHVAGISKTFHQSIETHSRPPQSRETIPLKTNNMQYDAVHVQL